MKLKHILTTPQERLGSLADMAKRPPRTTGAALVAIYQKRQPRRPHYLARLMELRNVTRSQMLKDIPGLDKSMLSRWLDEEKPATPGPAWAAKLGAYFSVAPDHEPLDIFSDPDIDWLARLLRGLTRDDKDRIKTIIQAAFPHKRAQ